MEPTAQNPCEVYAAALRAIIAKLHMSPEETAAFGKELAETQVPPRVIPYHTFTIAGWMNGELLPTPQAHAALQATLESNYSVPERTLDRLDELYEAALDWQAEQEYQPSELNHAMLHAQKLCGKSLTQLARDMEEKNLSRQQAKNSPLGTDTANGKIVELPKTRSGIHSILLGNKNHSSSSIFTCAMEELCQPPFSLCAIHDDLLPSFSPVVSRGSQGYISA